MESPSKNVCSIYQHPPNGLLLFPISKCFCVYSTHFLILLKKLLLLYLSIYSKALLTDESIISTTLLQCGRSHWDNIICNLEQKSALISIGNSWELFGFELFKLFSYEFKNVCSKFCNMILGLFCYYEWDLNYISKF